MKESRKGFFDEFHRCMLESHYRHYQFLTRQVEAFEERIAKAMEPYASQVELLISIPGIDLMVALASPGRTGHRPQGVSGCSTLLQLGGDGSRRERERGQAEEQPMPEGQQTLRRALTQSAWAVSHCKKGYLRKVSELAVLRGLRR